jgi:hypothetical protein
MERARNNRIGRIRSPAAKTEFIGRSPLAEPPVKRSFTEMLSSGFNSLRRRAEGLKKAVESPDKALERLSAEPISDEVIMARYRKPVFRLE